MKVIMSINERTMKNNRFAGNNQGN
jgi:hypothetical protein